ncbi:hypothetical protein V8D89_006797 [Ganoderma adspersum]
MPSVFLTISLSLEVSHDTLTLSRNLLFPVLCLWSSSNGQLPVVEGGLATLRYQIVMLLRMLLAHGLLCLP